MALLWSRPQHDRSHPGANRPHARTTHVRSSRAESRKRFWPCQDTSNIEGIDASDLFALNTMLGTTIEVQVVKTLNRIRDVWDPHDEWPLHRFDRQAQTPELRRRLILFDVALGIELKGWYLSKEAEPSFSTR